MDVSLMVSGAVLGVTAALSPGPTQTFLISQTVKHGVKEGILIAFVPLMTDVPIFLLTVGVLSQISDVDLIMGILSQIFGVTRPFIPCFMRNDQFISGVFQFFDKFDGMFDPLALDNPGWL